MAGKTRVIMVTSCKGGVGKSTVAANLGVKFAYLGYKTLVLDCDFGVRSLDLIMGLESDIIYDISDVLLRDIPAEKAIIRDPRSENLYFCAAPYQPCEEIDTDRFAETIRAVGEEQSFDFILIDTPGDIGAPFHLAAAAATEALVVSTYQPASIRAAERTGMLLEELGVTTRKLIVNCFDTASPVPADQPGLLELIDKVCIQLIAVIPYDARLTQSQARGEDVSRLRRSNVTIAFDHLACRLLGHNIPLFTGFRRPGRRTLMKRIR